MKRSTICYFILFLILSTIVGCSDSVKKNDQSSDSKITSGAVDSNVDPEKRSLGGEAKNPPK